MGTIDDRLTERLKEEDRKLAMYSTVIRAVLGDGMWLAQLGDEVICYSTLLIQREKEYLPQQAIITERARKNLQGLLGEMYAQYQPIAEHAISVERAANEGSRGVLRTMATVASWLSLTSSYNKFFAQKIEKCIEKRNECIQLSDLARRGVEFFAAQTTDNLTQARELERCKEGTKDIADIYMNMGRVHERIAHRYAEITDILG